MRSKPLQSYHQHSKLAKTEHILNMLAMGKICLVSDAGTLVSPTLWMLVAVAKKIGDSGDCSNSWANAALAAFSIRFPDGPVCVFGFPPHKKAGKHF